MFNQVTYNVLIERFKAFASGHYKIERFSHGQIDVTDISKEQRFPWMHVVPVSMQPSNGSRSFSLDVVFADMPRDKENKTEYQRESLSDCMQLAEDLLAEIKNGGVIFGEDVTLEEGSAVQPFMEEYTHVLTGVTLSLTLTFPWNWSACEIPADWSTGGSSGGGSGGNIPVLVLKVNNVDNVVQTVLNLVNGTNTTIVDLGDGRVQINSTGGVSSVSWGDIVGNIADQLDLATWFNEKADVTSLAEVAFSGDYEDLINKPTIPDASTFVPYTGATANVDIGTHSFIADNGSDNSEVSPNLFGVQNAAGTKYSYLDKTGLNVTDSNAGDTMNVNAGGLTFPDATSQYSAAVNADWDSTSGLSEILNKPTIPPAQIQSDWTQTDNTELDFIKNKPTLPATIGDMLKSVYDTDNDGVVDFAEALKTEVRNSTGSTLHKGHIVRLSGSTGNLPNAVYAQANNDTNSAQTFGVIKEDIPNNSNGYVITLGQIATLDTRTTAPNPFTTDTLVDGDVLYLSPTTAGHITNVKPTAPQHIVYVGMVVRTSPTNGTIQYRIQNGYELDELHDVAATTPANNETILFESSTGLWKNKPISASVISDSTSVGQNLMKLTNPSAISFIRINADNEVVTRTPAQVVSDLGISTMLSWRDMAGQSAVNTTTNTILFTALIPANTLQANDFLELFTHIYTTVTNGNTLQLRVYVNNANNLTGATQIGFFQNTVGTGSPCYMRNFYITASGVSGNIRGYGLNLNQPHPFVLGNAPPSNTTINTTVNQYIHIAVQMSNATSTTSLQGSILKLIR
jgi:hypothetical protein